MGLLSRQCIELYTKTVKLNDAISEEIRKKLIISDEGILFFNREEVKSPGQLGIKILQLIDRVKENEAQKTEHIRKQLTYEQTRSNPNEDNVIGFGI